MLLVVMPFVTSSVLLFLVIRPGTPSSVLAPSSVGTRNLELGLIDHPGVSIRRSCWILFKVTVGRKQLPIT